MAEQPSPSAHEDENDERPSNPFVHDEADDAADIAVSPDGAADAGAAAEDDDPMNLDVSERSPRSSPEIRADTVDDDGDDDDDHDRRDLEDDNGGDSDDDESDDMEAEFAKRPSMGTSRADKLRRTKAVKRRMRNRRQGRFDSSDSDTPRAVDARRGAHKRARGGNKPGR